MDDFGNSLGFHYDGAKNKCCRSWIIFHFYNLIGPGGCLNVACDEFTDPKLQYNHH